MTRSKADLMTWDVPRATHHAAKVAEVLAMVAQARRNGIYEEDPAWAPIDKALTELGYDVDQEKKDG
jgi:hypothetical protein